MFTFVNASRFTINRLVAKLFLKMKVVRTCCTAVMTVHPEETIAFLLNMSLKGVNQPTNEREDKHGTIEDEEQNRDSHVGVIVRQKQVSVANWVDHVHFRCCFLTKACPEISEMGAATSHRVGASEAHHCPCVRPLQCVRFPIRAARVCSFSAPCRYRSVTRHDDRRHSAICKRCEEARPRHVASEDAQRRDTRRWLTERRG
jgi:hypothetical protein